MELKFVFLQHQFSPFCHFFKGFKHDFNTSSTKPTERFSKTALQKYYCRIVMTFEYACNALYNKPGKKKMAL